MAWDGFFQYGDVEIINVTRTAVYARSMDLRWVTGCSEVECLPEAIGDADYVDPVTDPAPWADPFEKGAADFAGIIPLDVSGTEDSSQESNPFEFTTHGGNPGELRHATKEVVFSVALVGKSDCGVEYGFRWLKRALDHPPHLSCLLTAELPGRCAGPDLSFLACEPVCSATQSPDATLRHLRRTIISKSPRVTGKRKIPGKCGGAVWQVTWTATVGDPFSYGDPVSLLVDLGDGTDPYVAPFTGAFGETSYTWDPDCTTGTPPQFNQPLEDPTCEPSPVPPSPPNPLPDCWVEPDGSQTRVYAEIPLEAVPVVTRGLRIGFYDASEAVVEPCPSAWDLSHWFVSYIPAGATLTIDASTGVLTITDSGGQVFSVGHLVSDLGGDPITMGGLSCGRDYRIVVDWDPDDTGDLVGGVSVDLDLIPRSN